MKKRPNDSLTKFTVANCSVAPNHAERRRALTAVEHALGGLATSRPIQMSTTPTDGASRSIARHRHGEIGTAHQLEKSAPEGRGSLRPPCSR